jgi:hypothetical protein
LEEELKSVGDWLRKSTFMSFGKEEYQQGNYYSMGRYLTEDSKIGILL